MLKAKYIIRYEVMNGDWHYMIYSRFRFLFFNRYYFYERCNTPESAKKRLEELYQEIY
jgi:hypothetical protein